MPIPRPVSQIQTVSFVSASDCKSILGTLACRCLGPYIRFRQIIFVYRGRYILFRQATSPLPISKFRLMTFHAEKFFYRTTLSYTWQGLSFHFKPLNVPCLPIEQISLPLLAPTHLFHSFLCLGDYLAFAFFGPSKNALPSLACGYGIQAHSLCVQGLFLGM